VLVNTSATTNQAIGDDALKSRYPPVTTVVPGWAAVGFQSGTYKLAPTSRFAHAGEDGKDLGADIDAIQRAQTGPDGSGCGSSNATARPIR